MRPVVMSSAQPEGALGGVGVAQGFEPGVLSRAVAGQSREEAIFAETNCGCTDLVIDLLERLLGAVAGS
jgi:hypothetical protein